MRLRAGRPVYLLETAPVQKSHTFYGSKVPKCSKPISAIFCRPRLWSSLVFSSSVPTKSLLERSDPSRLSDLFPQLDTGHVSGSSESHRPLSQGGHVSSFTLECAVGTFFHPFIDDRFGRQKAIFIGFIRTLLGEALSCSSFQLRQLFIGRFISGMSLGVFSTMVPVWQSECSPATNRDRRVVIDGIFIASGYAVIYRTRDGFSRILRHDITWRVSLAIPGMLSIVLCAAIFFFLESARWLVYVGNVKKATAKLAQLRGVHGGAGLDKIGREIAAIEVSRDHRVQGLLVQGHLTVENGKLFYRCMLCIGLQFSIQMAGAQAISTYSATIFQQKLGFSNGIARIAAASAVAWKLLASFISLLTIDLFVRRRDHALHSLHGHRNQLRE